MITSAFTCMGPYAILILLGLKRVENRSAIPVPAKGRCAISCSKSFCKEECGEFVRWASRMLKPEDFETIPAWDDVKDWPGKVVGCCDYEGTLSAPVAEDRDATVMWDEGYGCWWNLSEVVAVDRPIPCRGNVGMWQMPSALAAQVTAADRLVRAVGERIATVEEAVELFRPPRPSSPVEVFAAAPKTDAKSIIIAHNHPSESTTPPAHKTGN